VPVAVPSAVKRAECLCCAVQSIISEYCASCQKRLQWIAQVGAKRGLRKPNIDEVRQAKVHATSALDVMFIYRRGSMQSQGEVLP